MRKFFRIACTPALLPAILSGISVYGQDSLKTVPLREVVVTATRTEKSALETPRSVTVIGRQEIEQSLYVNVAELLSRTQGIYIVGTGQTPGTNQTLFLRGANGNHVNILIDGVRLSDPSSVNSALDLSELSLVNVERVEIIRGSHGPMYGTSGIGGVINIITRRNQQPGFHGTADVQAGTFGPRAGLLTANVLGSYAFRNGFYVNAGLQDNRTRGLNATVDTIPEGQFKTTDRDDFRKTDGLVKLGYRKGAWDASVSYKNQYQLADIDKGAFQDDDNSTLRLERSLLNYGASFKASPRWQLSFVGGWTEMSRRVLDDSSAVDFAGNSDRTYSEGNYRGKSYTHEVQGAYKTEHVQALLGAGHYDEEADFRTYYYNNGPFGEFTSTTNYDSIRLHASTKYLFGQAGLNGALLAPGLAPLNLSVSARLSRHNQFGNNVTVEVNPSWKLTENSLLYASYATGFNAPSLYQLYDPVRGNPELGPETSATVEAGWKSIIASGLTLQVSAFWTVVNNAVEYVYLWNPAKPADQLTFSDYLGDVPINVARQGNRGIELSLQSNLFNKVTLNGNLGLVEGSFTYRPEDLTSEKVRGSSVQLFSNGAFLTREVETNALVRRPRITASADLAYTPVKKGTAGVLVRTVGTRNDVYYDPQLGPFGALNTRGVAGYFLTDLYARYAFNRHFSLAVRGENIFNVRYYEIYGYQTRGRGAYLKAAFTW